MYTPNNTPSKNTMQKLTWLKRKTDKSIITVGNFYTIMSVFIIALDKKLEKIKTNRIAPPTNMI